jgi:hypothetical protein
MMYHDYCFKSDSMEDMLEQLTLAGLADLVDDELIPNDLINIDVIGIISKASGEEIIDSEGNKYRAYENIPGWHFNVRSAVELTTQQLSHFTRCNPETPERVWS